MRRLAKRLRLRGYSKMRKQTLLNVLEKQKEKDPVKYDKAYTFTAPRPYMEYGDRDLKFGADVPKYVHNFYHTDEHFPQAPNFLRYHLRSMTPSTYGDFIVKPSGIRANIAAAVANPQMHLTEGVSEIASAPASVPQLQYSETEGSAPAVQLQEANIESTSDSQSTDFSEPEERLYQNLAAALNKTPTDAEQAAHEKSRVIPGSPNSELAENLQIESARKRERTVSLRKKRSSQPTHSQPSKKRKTRRQITFTDEGESEWSSDEERPTKRRTKAPFYLKDYVRK